jgi:hypothetical protein
VSVDVHFKAVLLGGLTPHRLPFGGRLAAIEQKTTLISHVNIVSPIPALAFPLKSAIPKT